MEIWREIPGYEGYYSVSTLGRIRRENNITNSKKGTILKATNDGVGYKHLTLCKNGRRRTATIHSLVAETFLGKPRNMEVNHIDGIKSNNELINLELVTSRQNHQHASRIGLKAVGEKQHLSKLTSFNVIEIRNKYKTGKYTQTELGKEYGVHYSAIGYIVNYKTWKHIK